MKEKAFHIHAPDAQSRWLVTCDHASNRVPPEVGDGSLGLPQADMERHIAYDVGALGLTKALADRLGASAVASNFSRLVIDPNRGEQDPTLVMRLYDGTLIPENRHIQTTEIDRRLNCYYRPYHEAYEKLAGRRDDTVLVAVHSFTPQLRARAPRPWHIGILYDPRSPKLSEILLRRLRDEKDICVGDNEPYFGHLPGDSIDRHALQKGRENTLIELRNDLIETESGQVEWADRLAPILESCLDEL